MAELKEIGKLKKNTRFRYYGETQVYVVTQSGHGIPSVLFRKEEDRDQNQTFNDTHKKCRVEVVQ